MVERLTASLAELKRPAIVVSHGVSIRFLRGLFLRLDRAGIFGLQPSRQDGVFRRFNGQVDFLEPWARNRLSERNEKLQKPLRGQLCLFFG